jgi:cytochrome P450
LYPVAPIISRTTLQDIHYKDFIIPKDSTVLMALGAMSRQPWIRNPLDFEPERWYETAPQVEELKEMYLPFSAGKRSCIGQNLALMEIRVIVANLVRYFDIGLVCEGEGDIELDLFVTLKPVELQMKFLSRSL